MTKIKIGKGGVYNADACSVAGADEINITFKFDKFDILVRAGENIKHPILAMTSQSTDISLKHSC